MMSLKRPIEWTDRLAVTVFAAGVLSCIAATAAIGATTEEPTATPARPGVTIPRRPAAGAGGTAVTEHPPSAEEFRRWHEQILTKPRPTACSTATYPDTEWHASPCKEPPHKALPPSRGLGVGLDQVGNGPDFSAVAPSGHISQARGSFDPATSVTSECDVQCPNGICPVNPSCAGQPTDSYTLQLNTKPFTTTACSGSPNPNQCKGWEQFVYESGGFGFIQYWLLTYGPAGTACPMPHGSNCVQGSAASDGWCPFSFSQGGAVYCVVNASQSASPPAMTAANLANLSLSGTAAGFMGMGKDSVTVTTANPTQSFSAMGNNYFSDLGSQWTESEFNAFGDGGGSQAVFNAGAKIAVRGGVNYGGSAGPGCDLRSFTGESNNLTLNNVAPVAVKGSLPALLFTEVSPAPAGLATCADATSVGDTHLTRFDGYHYDFQATGDFLLAQAGPEFSVHARQARANTEAGWIANASITKAVATQMGRTQVALYIWPVRLTIDGRDTDLEDGKSIFVPTGVRVGRRGTVYTVAGPDGDTVRATVNNNGVNQWIDVRVGFGRSMPSQIDGLLGVPSTNRPALKLAGGRILSAASFTDLYRRFADDWRVDPRVALLAPDPEVRATAPERPLYARDLQPDTQARARATCNAAGVRDPTLLDDCILDTAVLGGGEVPARAFMPGVAIVPRATMRHLTAVSLPR